MSAPKRIQLSRTKGWRKPEDAIVVARPSRWGNPFTVEHSYREWIVIGHGQRWTGFTTKREATEKAVELYRRLFRTPHLYGLSTIALLVGHDLACWCPLDQPCHADVLLELANHPEDNQ